MDLNKMLDDFLPKGVISRIDMVGLVSCLIIDELDKFGIFKLKDNVIICKNSWYNLLNSQTNSIGRDGRTSFSSFIEECFNNFHIVLSDDIVNSINLCCYYRFTLYYLLSGDYNISFDDISIIENFKLNKEKTLYAFNKGCAYYKMFISLKLINRKDWFSIMESNSFRDLVKED